MRNLSCTIDFFYLPLKRAKFEAKTKLSGMFCFEVQILQKVNDISSILPYMHYGKTSFSTVFFCNYVFSKN